MRPRADLHGQVGAGVGEEERRAVLEGGLGADDRGQRVVVDDDELGRVDALLARLAQHDGHRLADEAHPVGGQRRTRALRVELDERGRNRDVEVGRGERTDDARCGRGGRDVDPGDPGVRHGRTDEAEVQGALDVQVADVGAPASEQFRVLDPLDLGPQQ